MVNDIGPYTLSLGGSWWHSEIICVSSVCMWAIMLSVFLGDGICRNCIIILGWMQSLTIRWGPSALVLPPKFIGGWVTDSASIIWGEWAGKKSHERNGAVPDPFLCQMYPVICGNMCSSSLSLCHKLKWASSHMHAFLDISTVILEAGGCSGPVDSPISACTENN